ncbi:MAG: PilZ domain-containing protein [Gammaproteobacteria bacterium]|nr:PilZ domain-containing protein [Gammaproteobacteria bacterium]
MSDFSSSIDAGTDRGAYRVAPDPNDPVILQLDGMLARVLDISANGFSCISEHVKPHMRYRVKLDLPTEPGVITAYVDINLISEDGLARCQFVGLKEEDQEQLHRYVLHRQKAAINAIKSTKSF